MDDAWSRAETGASRGIEAARLEALARDWLTLWQSEFTAMAADRELQEVWSTLIGLWANAAGAQIGALTNALRASAHEQPRRAAAPEQPPRSASAAAPSESGDAAFERLHRRIAELEARLATLERADPSTGPAS